MTDPLLAILDNGRALTARELAVATRADTATVETRLAALVEASLVVPFQQGPHAYYRHAARIQAPTTPLPRPKSWKGGDALRNARTCYGHFAGLLGLAITDALVARDYIVLSIEDARITSAGVDFLTAFGVDLDPHGRSATPLCRPCLDWSERRPHLTGLAATRLAERCFELGWTERIPGTRAVAVTNKGRAGFAETWGLAASAW